MKTLITITGTEIKVSTNRSKRIFTIKKNGFKYRTNRFEKDEFINADWNWTGNDWQNFLKTDDYYAI